MENILNHESWEEILERLASYEGSVNEFCKENNLSRGQLYYYKRRFSQGKKPTFHAIALNSAKPSENAEKAYKDIRIEIGKASIFIPSNERELLKSILKELAIIC